MRTVSLREANQQFSRLIASVEGGETVVITRRGRPIARLSPHAHDRTSDPRWQAALRRMVARLEEGADLGGLKVDRDELYER